MGATFWVVTADATKNTDKKTSWTVDLICSGALDFVVGALKGARGNGIIVPGQDAVAVGAKGSGKTHQHRDFGSLGLLDPVVKKGFGGFFGRLIPQLAQILFEIVGRRKGFVDLQCLPEAAGFTLCSVEVLRAFEQAASGYPLEDAFRRYPSVRDKAAGAASTACR